MGHGEFFVGSLPDRLTKKPTKDTHGHNLGSHAAHGPEATFSAEVKPDNQSDDTEKRTTPITDNAALTQIIGIAILEFGVALHRQVISSPIVYTTTNYSLTTHKTAY